MLIQVHETVLQTAILEIADGLTGAALEAAIKAAKTEHDNSDDAPYAYVETLSWKWSEVAPTSGEAARQHTMQAPKVPPVTNTSGNAHCPHDGICHTSEETCAQAVARVALVAPARTGS